MRLKSPTYNILSQLQMVYSPLPDPFIQLRFSGLRPPAKKRLAAILMEQTAAWQPASCKYSRPLLIRFRPVPFVRSAAGFGRKVGQLAFAVLKL